MKIVSHPDVVVVGGGISGLAAAFRLQQQGLTVTVLEAADAVGGKMVSTERDGYVLNRGATTLPSSFSNLIQLCADSGLGRPFKPLTPSIGIPRDGRMRFLVRHAGLGAAVDGIRTDLLSWRSKLLLRRFVADVKRWRQQLDGDENYETAARLDTETVASYAQRRLNQEILDYLIDPLLRGLYLSETSNMSVVDLFLSVTKLGGGGPMEYPSGIDFLAKRLASFVDVRTGATVRDVRHVDGGVRTVWHDAEGEHTIDSRGCVLAVNGPVVPKIYPDLSDRQRELIESIRYKSVLKATFALRRLPPNVPTIVPVPRAAGIGLGVVNVDTRAMPHSAPAGKAVVSGHWVDEYSKAAVGRSDEELLPEMIEHMESVIPGLSAELEFAEVVRWEIATNARYIGFYDTVSELRRSLDPDDVVQLAGDFLGISGTVTSVESGERAAAALRRQLRSLASR
jgi:oxygen-dependent protoporphyrinogen oxidase